MTCLTFTIWIRLKVLYRHKLKNQCVGLNVAFVLFVKLKEMGSSGVISKLHSYALVRHITVSRLLQYFGKVLKTLFTLYNLKC